MRRHRKNHIGEAFQEPNINITPLIDVVFVILIAFIVMAPLLELDRIQLASASKNPLHTIHLQDPSALQIHVHKDNSITCNGRFATPATLLAMLCEVKRTNPQVRPQLFHDKKAYFGTYQSVKNTIEAAGFEQLDIVLMP